MNHPLRVRILDVLNERDMSPSTFVDEGYADFFFGRRPTVSHVAYHFRELAEYECLEPVVARRAKSSVETTYRSTARAEWIGEDWTDLDESQQYTITKTVAQGLIARIDGALTAQTINSRADRQISWFAMQLDEQGWAEAAEVLAEAYAAVSRIRQDAEARLAEAGERGVAATAAILQFESPEDTPRLR